MTQQSLFEIQLRGPTCEELTAEAEASIMRLFESGAPACVAHSSGKDSSVVTNLTLTVARRAKAAGLDPLVVITSSRTLVENPEVDNHLLMDHVRIKNYAKRHELRVISRIVEPTLAQTFQMRVLTGRGLPAYVGTSSDCSQDLKITPQITARRKLFRELKSEGRAEPVTLLGTRQAESAKRGLAMLARGDRHDKPTRNKAGDLVLSPIARWDTDSVWEYLGLAGAGIVDSYSDFAETRRIYAAASGTSCVIVADAIEEGAKQKKAGKCGARHGCWTCLQTVDRSLEAMVEFEPRYQYAKGLLRFTKFLRAIRYDFSRRSWVGRTIRKGYIRIQPDTFNSETIRLLTRFMLQLDYDERKLAREDGRPVLFQCLDLRMLIGVDAMQSLNGVARPFSCWSDLRDIESGIRYDIPEIPEAPRAEVPSARFLKVGSDWDEESEQSAWDGLRNPLHEALTERSGCTPNIVELPNGRSAWEMDTEQSMSVDEESAYLIEEFEKDRLLEMHDSGFAAGGITSGYLWYLSYGVLSLSHSQQSEHDMVARRTAFKDRHGLTMEYDLDDLLKQTVGFAELPPEAASAWGGSATTETAQTAFLSMLDESVEEEEMAAA